MKLPGKPDDEEKKEEKDVFLLRIWKSFRRKFEFAGRSEKAFLNSQTRVLMQRF